LVTGYLEQINMEVTHTHTMKGTLLVILDYNNTYEVQRTAHGIGVFNDPGSVKLDYKLSQRLVSLFLQSEAANY
tara:strand:- start:4495 stop:4716 length:222 start_codon:yes stop_codon:yes gene_type:complete